MQLLHEMLLKFKGGSVAQFSQQLASDALIKVSSRTDSINSIYMCTANPHNIQDILAEAQNQRNVKSITPLCDTVRLQQAMYTHI